MPNNSDNLIRVLETNTHGANVQVTDTHDAFSAIGFAVPNILLPDKSVNLSQWSVIACDQYTSQPSYWQDVSAYIDNAPSTYHLILPEVYLHSQFEERITRINKKMSEYLNSGILSPHKNGLILTERTLVDGSIRYGLMIAVDLEQYDYEQGSKSLIRATEATIIDRLPPRLAIRKNAPLELPHTMVLIDDPKHQVFTPLIDACQQGRFQELYNFDLMMNGGHLNGYHITENKDLLQIASALKSLLLSDNSPNPLLCAIGDGNHSLAAAKSHWNQLKSSLSDAERKNHPARFSLVELVNLHSDALNFEPIHRALFHTDASYVLQQISKYFQSKSCKIIDTIPPADASKNSRAFTFPFAAGKSRGTIVVENPSAVLPVAELQNFLDKLCAENTNIRIDYIHGDDELLRLAEEENCFCFFLPPIDKSVLFKTVIEEGSMPRKAFSMGHADDKRFYLEARQISL